MEELFDTLINKFGTRNNLKTLPQYALDRDVFCEIFGPIYEILIDVYPYEGYAFKFWYNNDEWYILHKQSGTLINWYKHLGRTNTCNKDLSLDEYKEFVRMLYEELTGDYEEDEEDDED